MRWVYGLSESLKFGRISIWMVVDDSETASLFELMSIYPTQIKKSLGLNKFLYIVFFLSFLTPYFYL